MNNNLLDYKLSTFMDHPRLKAVFAENPEPTSAYGTKALGEPPTCSVALAIRNAVYHATGVGVNEAPVNPHDICSADLKKKVFFRNRRFTVMYDIKALYEAESVQHAISLLQEHPQAQIIAGGSDVLVQIVWGRRTCAGKELVSIYGLDEMRGDQLRRGCEQSALAL